MVWLSASKTGSASGQRATQQPRVATDHQGEHQRDAATLFGESASRAEPSSQSQCVGPDFSIRILSDAASSTVAVPGPVI